METVQNALSSLMLIEPSNLTMDSAEFPEIQRASQTLISALELLGSDRQDVTLDLPPARSIISALGTTKCLQKLFEFRKAFHSLAVNSGDFDENAIVVCWVDIIFARFSDAVLLVLQDRGSKDSPEAAVFHTIAKHRSEANLHAAAQLPHSWEDTVEILSSEYASPAATRLAIRLLYAVYVVAPSCGAALPWTQNGPGPACVLRVLQTYVHRCREGAPDPLERASCAMVVAVYAAASQAPVDSNSSPFRPYTQAILLSHMQRAVMADGKPGAIFSPPSILDAAHNALLAFGDTLPWIWGTWDDDRTNGYDTVLYLTTTWLHSLKREGDGNWESLLLPLMASHPEAASIVFSNLLLRVKMYCASRPSSTVTLDVISKACTAAVWLMKASRATDDSWTVLYGDSLCSLFILLTNIPASAEARDVIIEGLTYIEPEMLRKIFDGIRDDIKIDLRGRLDEELRRLTTEAPCSQDCREVRQMVQLLSILWAADVKTSKFLLRHSTDAFVRGLLRYFSIEQCHRVCFTLVQTVWTLLAIIKRRRRINPAFDGVECTWEDESIYSSALDQRGEDLWTNLSFASYVIATAAAQDCEGILYALCWDFMQDTFYQQRDMPSLDGPGALLPTAFSLGAMKAIISNNNEATIDYIKSSPWTYSLLHELEGLSGNVVLTSLAKTLRTNIRKILSARRPPETQPVLHEEVAERATFELYCWKDETRLCLLPIDLMS